MSVPTQAQLYDEVDRIFRDRDPAAPEKLDPDDPDHRHHIEVWLELRDDVVNQWANDVFFGYFPGAGKLDPNDPADAELVEYWLDIRDRIRDDASPRYDLDAAAVMVPASTATVELEWGSTGDDAAQPSWIAPRAGRSAVLSAETGDVIAYGDAMEIDLGGNLSSLPDWFPPIGDPEQYQMWKMVQVAKRAGGGGLPLGVDLLLDVADIAAEELLFDKMHETMMQLLQLVGEVGWTFALGLSADVTVGFNVNAGAGLYLSTTGEAGFYGSFGFGAAAALGLSVTECFTAVVGGPERFAGQCLAVEATVGLAIVGGGTVLFDKDGVPFGVAGEIGFGATIGAPAIAKVTNTRLWSF